MAMNGYRSLGLASTGLGFEGFALWDRNAGLGVGAPFPAQLGASEESVDSGVMCRGA